MYNLHDKLLNSYDDYDENDYFKTEYDNVYINLYGTILKTFKKQEPKLFKGRLAKNGYMRVSISRDIGRVHIHRLMGLTFLKNPHNLRNIDHIDRNKLNNNIRNLRWFSQQDNMLNVGGINNIYYDHNNNIWLAKCGKYVIGRFQTEIEARACKYGWLRAKNISP